MRIPPARSAVLSARTALLAARGQSTIWPVYFRAHPRSVSYWRECVRCADGGHVTLDWLLEPRGARGDASEAAAAPSAAQEEAAAPSAPNALPPLRADSPVLILLSGIAGGSADSYVQHFVAMARQRGMRPVCFNSRGCANGPVTVPQFYSASFTGCAPRRAMRRARACADARAMRFGGARVAATSARWCRS
jgi:predicted alpha/beta-fold hydrolase